MRNNDFIDNFMSGFLPEKSVCNHLLVDGNKLYNYSTEILEMDRKNKTIRFNVRKYSSTTSKIQSHIYNVLKYHFDGWTLIEYEGEPCNYWNYGHMGAPNWKMSDLK